MILIFIIITIIYLLLIGSLVFGFNKIPEYTFKKPHKNTTFSILIPFRNEASNLQKLIDSINQLDYPKDLFEVIFIDDASEDASVEIIQSCLTSQETNGNTLINYKIIVNKRTTNSPKKDAITTAIYKAKYNWVITTDADCQLPKLWLHSFNNFIQNYNSHFIAAPVIYKNCSSFLNRFQVLDLLSLQGATIGGFGLKHPFLCNGANLAYKKDAFIEINGFKGNTDIASGDDIFLLEKMTKLHPEQTHYLKCKNAIVITQPQPTWQDLKAQRLRWAAKTTAYNNWFGKLTGFIVLLMNATILVGLLLSFIQIISFKSFFYLLFIKFSIDFYLIYKSAVFFNQKHILISYIFGFILYPFFSVYIAILSGFKGYTWKGRHFKK
jgi:cellulose synthase/poly-beta-1,6-N-acetylglucosamine synthase-like glycosyltransferase